MRDPGRTSGRVPVPTPPIECRDGDSGSAAGGGCQLLDAPLRTVPLDRAGDIRTRVDTELDAHARQVALDRLLAQVEVGGDFAVGLTRRDQFGHLALAPRQRRELVSAAGAAHPACPAAPGAPDPPADASKLAHRLSLKPTSAELGERLLGAAQLGPGSLAIAGCAERLAGDQPGPRGVDRGSGSVKPLDGPLREVGGDAR